MAVISANFETGTNGNTIATSDTGSATAWDLVTIGASATITYDNSNPAHNSLAGKYANGGSAVNTYTTWSTAWGTQTDHYGRMNFNLGSLPGSLAPTIFNTIDSATRNAGIGITTTGKLQLVDRAGATTNGTATIAANTWYRIEWHIVHSTTVGSINVNLFNLDGTVAIDSVTRAGVNTGANSTSARFGACTTNAITNWTVNLDDIFATDTSMTWPKGSGSRLDVAGTYKFKAPYNIAPATITAALWGAGGGGGGGLAIDLGGSGGGGGGFSQSIPSVAPGTTYTIVLGAAGTAGAGSGGNGGAGADSTWETTTIVAKGGGAGGGDAAPGGAGGVSGTGTTKTTGGAGFTTISTSGGGGGGSGGSTGNGGSSVGIGGGAAGTGSPAGATGGAQSAVGISPGSGGGGGIATGNAVGNKGADGSGTLTWTANNSGLFPAI